MAQVWDNLRSSFRQLRWRLTWSYTAVTVGALLVVVLILALLILPSLLLPNDLLAPGSADFWYRAADAQSVPLARYLLAETPVNTEGIAALVNYSDTARFGRFDLFHMGHLHFYVGTTTNIEMFIIGADGALLGRTHYPAFPSSGEAFDAGSIPGLAPLLAAALAGERDPEQLVAMRESSKELIVTAPVYGFDTIGEQLLGIVVYTADTVPTQDDLAGHTLSLVARAVILFIFSSGVMGAIFGSWTAKRMADRLQNVTRVTNAWSQGDFTQFIDDGYGDEISTLARRLNTMAGQLQDLLQRHQAMAISEERNRLARELHDSAKQQALAASFQLGTAITLYERDAETAREHLLQADALVDAVRKELTDLILELRPQSADGRNFAEIVREYAVEWAHQNAIEVEISTTGEQELPIAATQSMFRILQEALANIARHSAATHVAVHMDLNEQTVTLTVTDDGDGFDTGKRTGGMGLSSMRERATALNGEFTIESGPGQGTAVSVTIPVHER